MSCQIITCPVKRLVPAAQLPVYGSVGAAAADIHTVSGVSTVINPGCSVVFPTGLAFKVPDGYEIKVHSRSGHGFKSGIRLSNCTGILDSDYTGELMVKLHNDSDTAYRVEPFERICQIQICKAPQHQFHEVSELPTTARGVNGFGSTGTTVVNQHHHVMTGPADGFHGNVAVSGAHSHSIGIIPTTDGSHAITNVEVGAHDHGANRYK